MATFIANFGVIRPFNVDLVANIDLSIDVIVGMRSLCLVFKNVSLVWLLGLNLCLTRPHILKWSKQSSTKHCSCLCHGLLLDRWNLCLLRSKQQHNDWFWFYFSSVITWAHQAIYSRFYPKDLATYFSIEAFLFIWSDRYHTWWTQNSNQCS